MLLKYSVGNLNVLYYTNITLWKQSSGPGVMKIISCSTELRMNFFLLINILKRNRNATLFQWKTHWVVFKVVDRDNEPSSFQVMLTNSTKHRLKWLSIKKETHPHEDNVGISLR